MGYIYKITNLINQKGYIGLTRRKPETRWYEHFNTCYGSKGQKFHIHNAILKYGWVNFSFEILEEVAEDEINERERYWIQYYNTYDNGYNETLGGEGAVKYDYKEFLQLWNEGLTVNEIASKMSCSRNTVYYALSSIEGWREEAIARRWENNLQAMNEAHSKSIDVYDLNGEFVGTFSSQREASVALFGDNRQESNISRVIKDNKGRVGEYQFRQCGSERPGQYLRTGSKPVAQYSLNGEYITTYSSCKEASQAIKGTSKYGSYIGQAANQNNKRKTAYGYKWRFIDET